MTGEIPQTDRAARTACTLKLRDGRRLGYAQYGAHGGTPVLYCHGFPASRLEARLAAPAAATLGVRLIAPDRPGYGLSDFHAARTIGGWPQDAAQLADALGISRFRVLGVSGGAPYALACAARLAGRVIAVGVVGGLGRLDTPAAARMSAAARFMFAAARRTPALSRVLTRGIARVLRLRPQWLFALTSGRLPPADVQTLLDPAVCSLLTESLREALRQGGRGAAHELALYARRRDFSTADIEAPCYLWHGLADTTVPVEMGRDTARGLPRCEAEFPEGEGHFSLVVRRMEHILATLARAGSAP